MTPSPSASWLSPTVSWARVLKVLLAALFASTCIGLWFGTAHRPEVQLAFPGIRHQAVYLALLATGAGGLVGICGLWLWRRWGVIVYGCTAVAGLGLDVLARAPVLHQVTVFVCAVAVFWLVYLNRERFRKG